MLIYLLIFLIFFSIILRKKSTFYSSDSNLGPNESVIDLGNSKKIYEYDFKSPKITKANIYKNNIKLEWENNDKELTKFLVIMKDLDNQNNIWRFKDINSKEINSSIILKNMPGDKYLFTILGVYYDKNINKERITKPIEFKRLIKEDKNSLKLTSMTNNNSKNNINNSKNNINNSRNNIENSKDNIENSKDNIENSKNNSRNKIVCDYEGCDLSNIEFLNEYVDNYRPFYHSIFDIL